ncbi:hypothetical protein [Desulforhopalus vacuolatus]|nr:hypothetical protein [Desulforhopalus vacuolatus]
MTTIPKVLTERIDDFVLLIGLLKRMGVVSFLMLISHAMGIIKV